LITKITDLPFQVTSKTKFSVSKLQNGRNYPKMKYMILTLLKMS